MLFKPKLRISAPSEMFLLWEGRASQKAHHHELFHLLEAKAQFYQFCFVLFCLIDGCILNDSLHSPDARITVVPYSTKKE